MNKIELIIKLALAIGGFLVAAIPSLIGIIKTIKDKKLSLAENDLLGHLNIFIEEAEKAYNEVNKILKAKGESAGSAKKETVLTKLQAYALEKGYKFDAEFWSAKIDEVVALTRQVNAVVTNSTTIASTASQLFTKNIK